MAAAALGARLAAPPAVHPEWLRRTQPTPCCIKNRTSTMSYVPRQPISFQSGVAPTVQKDDLPAVRLTVVDHPDEQGPALITQRTAEQLGISSGTQALLGLADGSDCVLPVAVSGSSGAVPDGQIAATAVQQYNLHLGSGIVEDFRVFVPPAGKPFELVDVDVEVTLLDKSEEEEVQVDARAVSRELLRLYLGLVLALNEACVLRVAGHRILLRVTATNTLDAEAQEEQVAYHCFRGLLTHDTQIYMHTVGQAERERQPAAAAAIAAAAAAAAAAEQQPVQKLLPQSMAAYRRGVVLLNARQRPSTGPSRSTVVVRTNDGEWFPVNRKLLRPCIALTKAVRSEAEGSPEVTVDVDTLTFDRVLIFLEALALEQELPSFGLHLCPQLLAAAQHLGLRALEEYCQERLGESCSRLRMYAFEEVKQLNAAGGCWLILDGMVLDVTRWLPEHPGGSRIIPRQSLNLDCSRFFEVYHASRESFIYLRQFYQGEILPEDRDLVPAPAEPPSAEFMQQLREYTTWRLQPEAPATHLGSKRQGGGGSGGGKAAVAGMAAAAATLQE